MKIKLIFCLAMLFIAGCSNTLISKKEIVACKRIYVYDYLDDAKFSETYTQVCGDLYYEHKIYFEYKYDNNKRVIEEICRNSSNNIDNIEKITYDDLQGIKITESFDENGNLRRRTIFNNKRFKEVSEEFSEDNKIEKYVYSDYDERMNLIKMIVKDENGKFIMEVDISYSYDAGGDAISGNVKMKNYSKYKEYKEERTDIPSEDNYRMEYKYEYNIKNQLIKKTEISYIRVK